MSANVVPEVRKLREQTRAIPNMVLKDGTAKKTERLFKTNDGAFELEADITPGTAKTVGLDIYNDKGELSQIYLDMGKMRLVMDRTRSGLTSFGSKSSIHDIEKEADVHEHREMKIPARAANSVNYQNDFALGTWAPLSLCNGKTYHLDIFVDKCSVEIFVDGGRIAMTNLVFPTQPYNNIKLYSKGGTAKVMNLKVYKLGM